MGIPGFFSRMTAAGYADTTKEIGRRGGRRQAHAIIDGPAFAYHVLRIAENRANSHGLAGTWIGSAASYADCGLAAVQWLGELEDFGFVVDTIFFDGALPASKRATRIKRLTGLAVDVDLYRRRHEKLLLSRASDGELAEFRRTQKDLVPPFLVQAVQEALLSSRFKDVVYCCPGEADEFCVAAARKACMIHPDERVAIFTNDSDLAVFDSGKQTKIVLLNTYEICMDDTSEFTTATVFWPSRIAAKIGCPDLIELAFYLYQNPSDSVAKLVSWIEPGKLPRDRAFRKFSDLYQAAVDDKLVVLQRKQSERQLLLGLDARISELVDQVKTRTPLKNGSSDFDIFLPFLVDDSSKASAWRIGSFVRDVAYKILLDAGGCQNAVVEHKRAGNGISTRKATSVGDPKLQSELLRLSTFFTIGSSWELPCTAVERWRFAIIKLVVGDFMREEIWLPSPEELILALRGYECTYWTHVQLSAYFQSMYYSIRMLLQVMRYVDRTTGFDKNDRLPKAKKPFKLLLETLDGMPCMANFFRPNPGMEKVVSKAEWTARLDGCLQVVERLWKSQQSKADQKKPKKSKKIYDKETGAKKLKRMATVDEQEEDRLAGNPFAALARE
ncbi:hypothetical protein LTR91_007244 [Friedmanniomyces endolithicus]|uniref:Asteroid domain-containing protein n=1 Tax=Friedmanniomyces endolithicus TaxID=329885 RepID=A0AAN6KRH0_9PEZI|nr:hypothetical protein LTR94_012410 [Friedmanniomyces endolithicus]KAK0779170.1 hypothetical protein LTR75_015417 [Friedmanniomyces endolithicus]KAK0800951.1 hypothetical protein LTR59_005520 [Friedmanniomyces endolithicus]KAK0818802.1 hypothetical protein LTR38_000900 [Friedmanniomyces endolithicus]KAK0835436.1 hypothetical protein LTR03_013908 [Friedmanniomyces endolithicus]